MRWLVELVGLVGLVGLGWLGDSSDGYIDGKMGPTWVLLGGNFSGSGDFSKKLVVVTLPETNSNFDPEHRSTLTHKANRSVSLCQQFSEPFCC